MPDGAGDRTWEVPDPTEQRLRERIALAKWGTPEHEDAWRALEEHLAAHGGGDE